MKNPKHLKKRILAFLLMTTIAFASLINPVLADVTPEELENAQRTMKEDKQSYENRNNEVKNNFKGKNVDLTSINSLMAQWLQKLQEMEAILSGSPTDLTIFWNLNGEEGDINGDVSEALEIVYDLSNLEDQKKQALEEKPRQLKDIERQVKELQRNNKKTQLDTSVINSYVSQMQALVAQMQSVANAPITGDVRDIVDTLRDIISDFDDVAGEFYSTINELNDKVNTQNQLENSKINLKDKQRTIKELERELKRLGKQFPPERLSNLQTSFESLKGILLQIESAINANDGETAQFIDPDFWDTSSDMWDQIQGLNEAADKSRSSRDIARTLKDLSRQLKESGRWVADLEREAKRGDAPFSVEEVANLQSIYQKMEDAGKRAQAAYNEGNTDLAQEILWSEVDVLRMQLEQITGGFDNRREEKFFQFELDRMTKELDQAGKTIKELLSKKSITEEKAKLCAGYVEKGQGFLAQLKEIQEQGKMDENEELEARFEQLGNQADRDCGEILDAMNDPNYEGFNDHFVREDLQNIADEVFRNMSARLEDELMNRVLERLGNNIEAMNSMIEKAGERWQRELAVTFEAMSFIDEDYQEELLNYKNTMLEKIREMDELIQEKSEELRELQDRIVGYNFYGSAGSEIEEKLEAFISQSDNLSESEITKKVRELERQTQESMEKSRREKFENGVIPFLDTDDNEWFGRYVADVAERGIVRGYTDEDGNPTGRFEPGRAVSVAEILKMSLELAGLGVAEGEPGQGSDHWASGYVKRAEELGMSIISTEVDLNRPATRGEVVKIILESLGFIPDEVGESSFEDVGTDDPNMKYIEAAKQMGLISGDGESNMFRPNDAINRAETAKIISNARKLLSSEDSE